MNSAYELGPVVSEHRTSLLGSARYLGAAIFALGLGALLFKVGLDPFSKSPSFALLSGVGLIGVSVFLLRWWWLNRSMVVRFSESGFSFVRGSQRETRSWAELHSVQAVYVRTAGFLGLGKITPRYKSLTLVLASGTTVLLSDTLERFPDIISIVGQHVSLPTTVD